MIYHRNFSQMRVEGSAPSDRRQTGRSLIAIWWHSSDRLFPITVIKPRTPSLMQMPPFVREPMHGRKGPSVRNTRCCREAGIQDLGRSSSDGLFCIFARIHRWVNENTL
jgi:hypothetical protein